MDINNIILFNISKAGSERSITFQWKTKCYHFVFIGLKIVRKSIRDFGKVNKCLLETEEALKHVTFERVSYNLDPEGKYQVTLDEPKFS